MRASIRSSPESEADMRPREIKSPGNANRYEACVKEKYMFVDEAAKLQSTSSITSKPSNPTDRNADLAQKHLDSSPSSTYSNKAYKIDPRLLAGATFPSVGPSICDATEVAVS